VSEASAAERTGLTRRLVTLTLLAGLLAATAGVVITQVLERGELVARAESDGLGRAERGASRIDDRIGSLREKLRLMSTRANVLALDPASAEDLQLALRIATEFDELVLYDEDGAVVAGAAAARLVRPDEVDPRSPAPLVETLLQRSPGEEPWLELSVPVEDPPGTVIGALTGRVPLSLITREATSQTPQQPGILYVIADDGTVLAHPELQRVLQEERRDVDQLPSGQVSHLEVEGAAVLAAVATLRSVPASVVVERTRQDVLAPARFSLGGVTFVVLAVVAAMVVAVILAGQRLLAPLGPLVRAVDELGAGRLGTRVQPSGTGEVAVLGEGFNRMASALEDREAGLRRAEQQARQSEERFRLLVEGVADHALVLLGHDGEILTWNSGARRVLGLEEDEAIGTLLSASFAAEGAPGDPLYHLDEDGNAHVAGWCRRGDERFWAEITVTELHDDDGAPYGYAAIVHDQTDQRAAAAALEDALAQEQRAADEQRRANELKDEFLAIAAHEIRTPLSAILGAAHVVSNPKAKLSDDERAQYQSMITSFAEDMRDIVERLLEFSRLQAGRTQLQPTPVDLRSAVDRQLVLYERLLTDHRIEVRTSDEQVVVDPSVVRHVLGNLVANAARFAPAGTTIEVVAEVQDDTLLLQVSDEGIGIRPEDHERIFELFRQAERRVGAAAGGTGVGLAIVRRYVELAGGEVTVRSAEGEGATFTVRLPLVAPHAEAPRTETPSHR
jgi:PAS domain S-box-containing protein